MLCWRLRRLGGSNASVLVVRARRLELARRGAAELLRRLVAREAAALGQALERARLIGLAGAHQELGLAVGARDRHRLLPHAEVALDALHVVVAAAVEHAAAALALDL